MVTVAMLRVVTAGTVNIVPVEIVNHVSKKPAIMKNFQNVQV